MKKTVKRCIDIALSFLLLLVAAPIMALVALAIRVRMGSPVLFIQIRPGLHGNLFKVYKFRTMKTRPAGQVLSVKSDTERLTPFGRLLRNLSLDELPQLWNVLIGDMSLVGPRPLLPEYLDRYTPEEARRHDVKPGVTGLAQVNGRNEISWERKLQLDVWYVDHGSLWLDFKILLLTFGKVVKREGVSIQPELRMRNSQPAHDGEVGDVQIN